MKSVRRSSAALAFSLLSLVLVAGCSTHQSQTYAKSSKAGTYFTVPYGWQKISQAALGKRESLSTAQGAADRASAVIWQEAYSPSDSITAADVFSLHAPQSPITFVRVRSLLPDEVNAVSYNFLRDIFVPLTTWLNSSSDSSVSPIPMTHFSFIDEYEVADKHSHGIRSVFSFTGSDGINQTFDQSALVSDDRKTMYVLLVRSESSYYKKHSTQLSKIADSWTIRGAQ